MKKLLIISMLFFSIQSFAQVTKFEITPKILMPGDTVTNGQMYVFSNIYDTSHKTHVQLSLVTDQKYFQQFRPVEFTLVFASSIFSTYPAPPAEIVQKVDSVEQIHIID